MSYKFILYKTTNMINGKIYVGVHATKETDNRYYLGSGVALKHAIKKYGKENFKIETLQTFDSSDDMYYAESIVVNNDFIRRKDTYNMMVGGLGLTVGHKLSEDTKRKISAGNMGKIMSEESKQKMSSSRIGMKYTDEHKKNIRLSKTGENNPNYGKTQSEDWIQKRVYSLRVQFTGRKWIHNATKVKFIKQEELDTYIADGWLIGRGKIKKELI